jgi:iron complex transport system substrate-binding protein
VLDQVGIKSVVLASHWETTDLGRAEWLKVMALLFNRERLANQLFDGIAARYEALAAKAKAQPRHPRVLTDLPAGHLWDVWPAPDALVNAGGDYFWPGASLYRRVDMEAVVQKARDADVWILSWQTPLRSIDALIARESRLAAFDAVRREVERHRPYIDQRMRPDLALADLVKILHPALVPDHEFVFYRRLEPPRTAAPAAGRR